MKCERCFGPRPQARRYCKGCEKEALAEMKSAGYFAPFIRQGTSRTSEMKEVTRETKSGTGHG